jgi:hypothetical protein
MFGWSLWLSPQMLPSFEPIRIEPTSVNEGNRKRNRYKCNCPMVDQALKITGYKGHRYS